MTEATRQHEIRIAALEKLVEELQLRLDAIEVRTMPMHQAIPLSTGGIAPPPAFPPYKDLPGVRG